MKHRAAITGRQAVASSAVAVAPCKALQRVRSVQRAFCLCVKRKVKAGRKRRCGRLQWQNGAQWRGRWDMAIGAQRTFPARSMPGRFSHYGAALYLCCCLSAAYAACGSSCCHRWCPFPEHCPASSTNVIHLRHCPGTQSSTRLLFWPHLCLLIFSGLAVPLIPYSSVVRMVAWCACGAPWKNICVGLDGRAVPAF